MFGYQESEYEVLDSFELTVEGHKQVFEIRKDIPNPLYYKKFAAGIQRQKANGTYVEPWKTYIAILGYDSENRINLDILLHYGSKNKKGDLEKDWETLKNNPHITIKELLAYSWIKDHHTGYDKSGSITMH